MFSWFYANDYRGDYDFFESGQLGAQRFFAFLRCDRRLFNDFNIPDFSRAAMNSTICNPALIY